MRFEAGNFGGALKGVAAVQQADEEISLRV